MNLSAPIFIGCTAFVCASTSFASTQLDTVTVAGSGNEVTLKDNPASVSILNRKQIEQKGADSVAELLRDIPGVQVADSSAAGMKRIRMRGESSRRITILVDGQEITDHSTFGTPILINPASIERIEVVRGPASVLYGAKAIGGVINIITRQGSEKAVELEVGGSYHSGSNGYQGYASVSGSADRFDYRVSVAGEEHEDRVVASGSYSDTDKLKGTSFDNTDINLHLGYKLGENRNHQVSLKANQYKMSTDSWTDPTTLTFPIEEFNIQLPKRDLNKYGLYYEGQQLTGPIKRIQADGYYQWVDRDFSNHLLMRPSSMVSVAVDSTSIDRNINYGGSVQLDLNLPQNHELITGLQYLMDDLDTRKSTTETVNASSNISHNNTRVNMETLSFFAQYTWNLPANFALSAGARFYHVRTELVDTNNPASAHDENTSNSQAVKSLGLTYTGFKHSTLRALYSEGYIMPTLLQMYTDTSAGRGVTTYGNPNLKPEISQNFELGWRFVDSGWLLDAAAFYTEADDYITSTPCSPLSLCPSAATANEYTSINADSAKSFGLELQLEYNIQAIMLTPYVSGTWMRRETTQGGFSTYHNDTPLLTGKLGARYEHFFNNSDVWLDVYMRAATKSTGQENTNSSVDTLAGYATAHLGIGGAFGSESQYQWNIHANNLLDKSYRASADELPGMGRNFILSMQARF